MVRACDLMFSFRRGGVAAQPIQQATIKEAFYARGGYMLCPKPQRVFKRKNS